MTSTSEYYQSKVAVVTGGTSGIGLALAEMMLSYGAKQAVLADVNDENLKRETARLNTAYVDKVLGLHCDVTKEEDVQGMIRKAAEFGGRIDILFNNAGAGLSGSSRHTRWPDELRHELSRFLAASRDLYRSHPERRKPDCSASAAALTEFVPGYDADAWIGVGAPKNTPPAVIDKLNKEINDVLADPKLKLRLADLGGSVAGGSAADYGRQLEEEAEKWGKVIRAANIKAE